MEQCHPWVIQEIFCILCNTEVRCRIHKIPSVPTVSRSVQPLSLIPPWRYTLILFSDPHLGLPYGLFSLGLPTKTCMHLSSSPYIHHAPPISSFLIWSPGYLVRSTNHEVPRYVVFISPLSSPFFRAGVSVLRWNLLTDVRVRHNIFFWRCH